GTNRPAADRAGRAQRPQARGAPERADVRRGLHQSVAACGPDVRAGRFPPHPALSPAGGEGRVRGAEVDRDLLEWDYGRHRRPSPGRPAPGGGDPFVRQVLARTAGSHRAQEPGHQASRWTPWESTMNVLVIDIGGTGVKLLATGQDTPRKFPSGPDLTPSQMVGGVVQAAAGWDYEALSVGYPGPVLNGRPLS